MIRKRIGNDITLKWTITTNGKAVSLEDDDLTLVIADPFGKWIRTSFEVKSNVIEFSYYGTDQVCCGKYKTILILNEGEHGQAVVDIKDAFELVPHSCLAGGTTSDIDDESITYTSDIEQAVDMSAYLRKDGVKTIAGNSIVGTGNIPASSIITISQEITSGDTQAVSGGAVYTAIGTINQSISAVDAKTSGKALALDLSTITSSSKAIDLTTPMLLRSHNKLASHTRITNTYRIDCFMHDGGGGAHDGYFYSIFKLTYNNANNTVSGKLIGYCTIGDGAAVLSDVNWTDVTALDGKNATTWNKYIYSVFDEGIASDTEDGLMAKEDHAKLTKVVSDVAQKQDALVSGNNIKTINNQSILGSGNIDIQGGGSSVNVIDNLTSTSKTDALSANQGRVLNEDNGMMSTMISTLSSNLESNYLTKTESRSEFANVNHGHNISQVEGLQSSLDGKASTTHTHAQSDVTGLSGALESKQDKLSTISESSESTTISNRNVMLDCEHAYIGSASSTNEIVKASALSGYATRSDLDAKAGKATTLAGYGITDAMTATEINTALESKQDAGAYITTTAYVSHDPTTTITESDYTANTIVSVTSALAITQIDSLSVEVVLFVSSGTEVTLPSGTPIIGSIDSTKNYSISILNGRAVVGNFD